MPAMCRVRNEIRCELRFRERRITDVMATRLRSRRQIGPNPQSHRLLRRVARQRDAMHEAPKTVIIVDRIMLGGAVVPEGNGTRLPAEAAGEFRAYLMGKEV